MRGSAVTSALLLGLTVGAQSLSGGAGGIGGSGGDGGLGAGLVGGVVGTLTHPELFMNDDAVQQHRDIETRLMGGLGLSIQAASLTGRSGPAETAVLPWLGFRFEGGASFTYRDRLMLTVNGGWGINGYGLQLDTMFSRIYHSNKNAEVRLAWHTLPKRNVFTQWSFGMGFGGTFQQADERSTDNNGFLSFTAAPHLERPYIAPEIGRFTAEGRDRFEVSLRYVKHLDDRPAWTSANSFNGSTATCEASDDHLALMMRYHLGFRKTATPVSPVTPPIEQTGYDTLPRFACKRQRVTLKLWDDAEMDGDTVSVLLNGRPMLAYHCLGHKPVKVRLDLEHGHNRLQVVAHNEGRIAPNTARGVLRRGKGREQLLIKTTRSRGEMLMLVRG